MANRKHIMIDAFPLVDDHFSGVGHYTLGIVQAIDEIAGEGKVTYSLIAPRGLAGRLDKYNFQNYKRIIRNPIPNRVIRAIMKFRLPIPTDLFVGRGIYYFPSFLAWPTWFSKSGVVIHDVSYVAVPDCVEGANREYLKKTVLFSLKNAKPITISKFSQSEISRHYKIPKKDIAIAMPSIDRRHFYKRSVEEIHKVKAKYDIFSEDYILSVGNVEPRKNYSKLVDAYTGLPKEITDKYPLVIVGAGSWNNKEILEKIQKAKEDGYRIINPKRFVLDEDMPALYSGAQFYVFVPVYEGFGMSPLEAYACGTPVIASDVASVPEAAGEAALYVDPHSISDIRKKMLKMFKETEKDREQFIPAIERHLGSLSWRPSAEATLAALTGDPLETFQSGSASEAK